MLQVGKKDSVRVDIPGLKGAAAPVLPKGSLSVDAEGGAARKMGPGAEQLPVVDLLTRPLRTIPMPARFEDLGVRQVGRGVAHLGPVLAVAAATAGGTVLSFTGVTVFGQEAGLGAASAVPGLYVAAAVLIGGTLAAIRRLKGAEASLTEADARDGRLAKARESYRTGFAGLLDAWVDGGRNWADFVEVHGMLVDRLRNDMGLPPLEMSPEGKGVYREFMAVAALCKRPVPTRLGDGMRDLLEQGVPKFRHDQKVQSIDDEVGQKEFAGHFRGLAHGDAFSAQWFALDYGRRQLALSVLERHLG